MTRAFSWKAGAGTNQAKSTFAALSLPEYTDALAAAMTGMSERTVTVYEPSGKSPSGVSVTLPASRLASTEIGFSVLLSGVMVICALASVRPGTKNRSTDARSSYPGLLACAAIVSGFESTRPGITISLAGDATAPTTSTPPGSSVRTTVCWRPATTWLPVLRTWTTGEVAPGAKPARDRMRWPPGGTTMPSVPAAVTAP